MKYTLGFDIGGTKCAVILGTETIPENIDQLIIAKKAFPTNVQRGYQAVLEELFDTADSLLAEMEIKNTDLRGIGISCGGPLDSKRGVIMCPPNLPDWDNVPIVKMAEEHFGVKTHLQNDANACAYAEWKYGAAKGTSNAVFLTFGTGMGAGLILNGRLYSGTHDMAGEVGHIRLTDDGPEGYGKNGSFEGYCSGGGIAKSAHFLAENSNIQPTYSIEGITAKILAEKMYAGDEFATLVYRNCAEKLAAGLSLIIDIVDPECIVIGSIYARNREFFDGIILPIIEKEALCGKNCKILPAKLGEHIGDFAALSLA